MMKNKQAVIISLVLVIAAFFGGKAYGQRHPVARAPRSAQAGMYGGMYGGGRGAFPGGTTGQVIAKDATTITVSTMGGGSKLILYSPSTTIAKSVTGAISDVVIGSVVSATGTTNPDGAVTATTIQIRSVGAPKAAQPAR